MPELNRLYCSRCQQSVYNCVIEGVRVPLVLRLVIGQPADTGPAIGLNDPGVKVPSFYRALMRTPLARVELCVRCVAEVFGVPVLAAAEDPALVDANGNGIPDVLELRADQPMVEQLAALHAPAFTAIRDAHEVLLRTAIDVALDTQAADPTSTVNAGAIVAELRAVITPSVDAPPARVAAAPPEPAEG